MRLARLVGADVTIEVIGTSDAEAEIKTGIVADAMWAARAAVEEGVVPGAGIGLAATVETLERSLHLEGDEQLGLIAVVSALRLPMALLGGNAEISDNLDPVKVLRCALRLACDAATRVVRTRTIELSSSRSAQTRD
jgi:chaperonin GroEL